MNTPMLKKEIAAAAGITPRTMRNNPKQWAWLKQFRVNVGRRTAYRREPVIAMLREKGIA